jgi:mannose-6-phosphate isomerase
MHKLITTIRPYAWGSRTALAALQGRPHPTEVPEAELWIGSHPGAPSRVAGSEVALGELIAADPVAALGPGVVEEHGTQLPFLLKILAVDAPLSLQVHPDAAQAQAGFAAEAHLPLDSPERNYRDERPKPELVYAVTAFEALCGFRAPGETAEVFGRLRIPALDEIARQLESGVRAVVEELLAADAELVDRVAAACRDRVLDHPAYRLAVDLGDRYPGDPGVLVAMMLNQLTLAPGQAMFLGPGVLHAYLSGTAVEVMANSDNVLRGGLTGKHIDRAELLRVLRFDATDVRLITACEDGPGISTWRSPAREFELSRIVVESGQVELPSLGRAQLLLCLDGALELRTTAGSVGLAPGEAVFSPATDGPVGVSGTGTGFRVTSGY